jgi:hypothetical protein
MPSLASREPSGGRVPRRAGVAALAALASALACGERVEARYPTFPDAERAGAVERGWIPAWVPRSATDIVEVHDLDTNAQVLRFRAPREALAEMASRLARVSPDDVPPPRAYLRAPWGEALREVMNAYAGTARADLEHFRDTAAGAERWVAVDARGAVAYVWMRGR